MTGSEVQLWVYDLTQGMAAALSPLLLGMQIEGVWHTSLVVHGIEFYYQGGVQQEEPGCTDFGTPLKKLTLGTTEVPKDLITDVVAGLGADGFLPDQYHLLHNNCNHFTNALATVLIGSSIPEYILTQHETILSSPLGAMLRPMLEQMEQATPHHGHPVTASTSTTTTTITPAINNPTAPATTTSTTTTTTTSATTAPKPAASSAATPAPSAAAAGPAAGQAVQAAAPAAATAASPAAATASASAASSVAAGIQAINLSANTGANGGGSAEARATGASGGVKKASSSSS